MRKRKDYKNGFTLVELVVAIALFGVIAVIISSTVFLADKGRKNSETNFEIENELIKFENEFENWLKQYDSVEFNIKVNASEISIYSSDTSEQKAVMTFDDGVFILTDDDITSSTEFSKIKTVKFSFFDYGLILCQIAFEKFDFKILHYIRAAQI